MLKNKTLLAHILLDFLGHPVNFQWPSMSYCCNHNEETITPVYKIYLSLLYFNEKAVGESEKKRWRTAIIDTTFGHMFRALLLFLS